MLREERLAAVFDDAIHEVAEDAEHHAAVLEQISKLSHRVETLRAWNAEDEDGRMKQEEARLKEEEARTLKVQAERLMIGMLEKILAIEEQMEVVVDDGEDKTGQRVILSRRFR